MRINREKTQKELTYQVVLDALALTTCYPAFLIIVDVPKIHMQQFWFTINKKDSTTYRLLNQDFDELPLDEEIVSFIKELGHKGEKPASPSKKGTLVIVEEEEPEPAKKVVPSKKPSRKQSSSVQIQDVPGVFLSKKKAPETIERSKGIDLLSEAALLEEAQVKKVLKRSRRDTTIHQAGASGDGAGLQPEVLDEPKGKSVDTHEGTGSKPWVLDVSKANSSKSEYKSESDSVDKANEQSDDNHEQAGDELIKSDNPRISDEEEETQDDEYVHTPEDYAPIDDETNDESNDVDEEEYDRIDKKLYGDVNVRLTDAEKDDEEMTHAVHEHVEVENVNQEGVGNQIKDDAQTTQKTEAPIPSSSISSDYGAKYLNFNNIPSANTEVISMMDIIVRHEVPRTSPLLTIPVSVIPKHIVVNQPETFTTASATTISSLLFSLFPHLQQSTPIPTPTKIKATTSTIAVPESKTLYVLHQRIIDLEKDVKELKNVDHSFALLSTIKSKVPNAVKEYIRTSLDDALYKVLKKHDANIIKEHLVPAEIVERPRQQYLPQKSIEDIKKIKMEHARQQQVPKETITSSTVSLKEFD
nr:hypothetical protein [Tanacetum cinerariifolium]